MLCVRYLFYILFVYKVVISQHNIAGVCVRPNNENGVCLNIKNCQPLLLMLLNNKNNNTAINFLRKSMCGYEGKTPKVCCELESILSNVNNNKTDDKNEETNTKKFLSITENVSMNKSESYSKLPSTSSCGRITSSPKFRIIGGHPAELGNWPWIAALGYKTINETNNRIDWLCGGTLISDRYVVTAALCVVKTGEKEVSVVRLGELDLDPKINDGASPIDVIVEKILIHENYNSRKQINDIALLKLSKAISFNNFIQPVCLPISSEIRSNQFENYIPSVAGWGVTTYHGPSSTMLMEAPVPVLDNAECRRIYNSTNAVIDERILCAGYKTGGVDTCQGDSGGPMVSEIGSNNYLIGVTSYGFLCAAPDKPAVYSRITYFVDWIVEKMNNS
ncbi:venom protease-like [Daktulosphaira vitifoliae]|uniref:venom protease-like n=1 Tax=Daktulosphaira vitifoliae TaxID=58002 RepID=UPI0021AA92DB|nr:venom protease-like [Daktulosphaira vitifoliae]